MRLWILNLEEFFLFESLFRVKLDIEKIQGMDFYES